jgi:UDP-glucose 4-epimerase
VIYGDGAQSRDFTYIGNVVLANRLAAEASAEAAGRVINVGAGTRTSLIELLEVISEIVGIAADPEFAAPRQGDVRDSQADLTLARRLLGYEPETGLAEGLEVTVEWFREHREQAGSASRIQQEPTP